MVQRAYQKWTRRLLLGLVLVLTACAAVVYRVDRGYRPQQPGGRGAAWLLYDRQLLRQSA